MSRVAATAFAFIAIISCTPAKQARDGSDVHIGYGDFRGTRLTEKQVVDLLKAAGIPESQLGKAVCVAFNESNFFTYAQHDNRFNRQPVQDGPKSATGIPLQYTFRAKPECLKNPNDSALVSKICVGTKNDNLKGYKSDPVLQQCLTELKNGMTTAAALMALGTPEGKLAARNCSFDYGLFEINDYWEIYGTDEDGSPAPCAHLKGRDVFNLKNNIECMKITARCNATSCNFIAWNGYKANKEKCDTYVVGTGLE